MADSTLAGRRVVVVGVSGSGKTTLARRLAVGLGVPHVELDTLHWEPGWQPAERDVFRARADQATAGEAWVLDGNYHVVRDIVWPRADTLVWLDYSLALVLGRVLRRTLTRCATGVELWNGNRERFLTSFCSRDSIVLWALKTHRRRRREMPGLLADEASAHLRTVRLTSPRAAEAWLATQLEA